MSFIRTTRFGPTTHPTRNALKLWIERRPFQERKVAWTELGMDLVKPKWRTEGGVKTSKRLKSWVEGDGLEKASGGSRSGIEQRERERPGREWHPS